jgi:hypothetical protein
MRRSCNDISTEALGGGEALRYAHGESEIPQTPSEGSIRRQGLYIGRSPQTRLETLVDRVADFSTTS